MDKDLTMEYIEWFVEQTDDGTFETDDDLAWFVMEALYDEFGEIGDIIDEVIKKRGDGIYAG